MTRIISLIASSTEIVHRLGMGDKMVGRSHECDFPPSVKDLPACTAPKFRTDGTSYEIDQRVKAIVQESLSVYRVDAKMLDQLKPSHIITQTQCEVCAVSLKDVEQAACQMVSSKPQIVSLSPNCLEDVYEDIRRVARSLSIENRGEELVCECKERIEAIRSKCYAKGKRKTIACIEWIDPLMAGGNWMPELIELINCENLFGQAGKHSPWMQWEDVVARDPDIILCVPCGFDNQRTLQDMPILKDKPGYAQLKAVKSGQVIVADGNQYFNRPGPRLVESLEILAEIAHPQLFDFGFRNDAWLRYS